MIDRTKTDSDDVRHIAENLFQERMKAVSVPDLSTQEEAQKYMALAAGVAQRSIMDALLFKREWDKVPARPQVGQTGFSMFKTGS